MPFVERCGRCVVSANIIKVFDLVDSDDPILAGECLVQGVERGTNFWKLNSTDSVLGLSGWEERVVVVVRHLVPVGC